MTLSQQAAVIIEAVEQGLFHADDVLRWADSVIISIEQPPAWLIELSTINPLYIQNFIGVLRKHAESTLPTRSRIQVLVLAWNQGILPLNSCLQKLFKVLIIEGFLEAEQKEDPLDERLHDALVEWDSLDCLDVIEPRLYLKFEKIFREYLADANEIARVLNWNHELKHRKLAGN